MSTILLDNNSRSNKAGILPLDGLRGLAVLLIIGFHFINNQYGHEAMLHANSIERVLAKATYFGWEGVDCFLCCLDF